MRALPIFIIVAILVAAWVGFVPWRRPASIPVAEKKIAPAAPAPPVVANPIVPATPAPPPAPPVEAAPIATPAPASALLPAPPTTDPVAEVQLTRMADGSWLVDQLYIVRGQGTAAEPFVVPWDLLLSASETFAPADGRWEVPRRVKWLDGKQLQIKGFLTSPTRTRTSDHLLLTWSAQDACCQGPPANPCQTVEVKLESPITLETHVLIGVTVEGTFKVHPRMAGGLRMSLFRLENARVVALGGR